MEGLGRDWTTRGFVGYPAPEALQPKGLVLGTWDYPALRKSAAAFDMRELS